MKIFIDTANIEEIKKAHEFGIVSGVTTNPSLIAKEGRDFVQVVKEITQIVDGPISAEVVSLDKDGMIQEAKELVKIHENIIIKIPMIPEGLKAISALTKIGIRTNCTLVFSANQGILAANAGATYISPFIGRIDDIGYDGMQVIEDLTEIFENYYYDTEIIAASIRHPLHVTEAAKAGADIATIPYKIIEQMMKNPLTDIGVEKFLKDWEGLTK